MLHGSIAKGAALSTGATFVSVPCSLWGPQLHSYHIENIDTLQSPVILCEIWMGQSS